MGCTICIMTTIERYGKEISKTIKLEPAIMIHGGQSYCFKHTVELCEELTGRPLP